MADYELPRDESGEVDWLEIKRLIIGPSPIDDWIPPKEMFKIIKAIDANARKEEREKCIKVIVDELYATTFNSCVPLLIKKIRERGEK